MTDHSREFHGQMIPWIYLLTAHILVFTGVSTGTGMNDAAQEFKSIPSSNKCLHANTETSYRTPKKKLEGDANGSVFKGLCILSQA